MEAKPLQVVVIDDVADNLRLFSMMIKQIGATLPVELRTFPSAEDALRSLRQTPPDLVLCDERLGGQSGTEFFRELRKYDSAYEDIPFIIVSGKNSEKDWKGFFEAGVSDFLPKPVTVEKLRFVFRIAEWMRRARVRIHTLEQTHVKLQGLWEQLRRRKNS